MKKLLYLILLWPIFSFSQSTFTVKGDVRELKDGDKLYLSYRLNDVLHKDSTVARNGSFQFSGKTNSIAMASISARENPFGDIDILHNNLNFYIEPGNITITGMDSLKYATAGGTSNNRDFTELRDPLRPFYKQLVQLSDSFDALPAEKQKYPEQIAANRIAYYRIKDQMAPLQFSFINKHPGSYISLVTLQGMLNQIDINAVDNAYQSLSVALKTSPEGAAFYKKIAAAKKSRTGSIAGDFELPDNNGKMVKLSGQRGKYVLVDFWASWCIPCRQENPNLKAAFERYRSKNFSIISVSIDGRGEKTAWLEAIKKDNLPWTQLLDAHQKVRDQYGVTYIPANFLLDPTGHIISVNLKDIALMDKLSEILSP